MATRVLLIDDDTRMYELLAQYLGQNGITVSHAPDGGRGLAALEAGAYDAVLLDVMMPGMDGPSTVLALREDPATRDIPVIFLTAKVGGDGHRQWEHLDVSGVIPKPF
ncbi:response regulator, partial [Archangium sp.]|uniref:response regulator n=1 Tax=Archangium sp. TaxID=1872627 RepID=UPI002ED78D28